MDHHARQLTLAAGLVATGIGWFVPGCGESSSSSSPGSTVADLATISERTGLAEAVLRRAFGASPLPEAPPDPTNRVADVPEAAAFGETLFFDPALSGGGDVSCGTCHRPELRFTDGLPRSQGVGTSLRHAPSLVDAAHHRWLNWDGRSDSMWSHAIRPIENPEEMGGDRTALVRGILRDDRRRAAYESLFGPIPLDPETLPAAASPEGDAAAVEAWNALDADTRLEIDRVVAGVGKALAAYQRTLRSEPTRFDRWVEAVQAGGTGESILAPAEQRGLALFFGRGECWECHAGPLFSDGEFHNIGIPVPGGLPRDEGRYRGATLVREDPFNAAGVHSDQPDGPRAVVSEGVKSDPDAWGAFRTPGLRGVGLTPPYMHDGSMPDLETVVRFYSTLEGAVQLDHHRETVLSPLDFSDEESADLIAFLRTLEPAGP